jgi:hypothetical protein
MVKCLECNIEVTSDIVLHKHLRSHKITQAVYYQKHYTRYDKYDKSLIKFKNKEYYFNTDFNSRTNLKAWLESVPKEEAKAYLRDYFLRRRERKGLVYALTQVELRTLPIPGMKYLNELFGGYNEFCESIGLKPKYTKYAFSKKSRNIKKFKIIVDTREQKPLLFNLKTKVDTLPFGDYKLDAPDNVTCNCYIERKSASDLFGTLSSGFERFKREILRSQEAGANLIVVVESTLENIAKFPYTRPVFGKIGTSPEYLYHGMREIIQEFPNVQFLFVKDREESSRVIEKIFASNCEYKDCDLQFIYDIGIL